MFYVIFMIFLRKLKYLRLFFLRFSRTSYRFQRFNLCYLLIYLLTLICTYLKIKYNNWNNVDWCEDNVETFTIDPMNCQFRSTYENVEFEKKFYNIIFNSKYKSLLLGEEKITVNYQIVNEILFFLYAKMKVDYSLSQILVMLCEYCGINIQTMWKKLSSYAQMEILKVLRILILHM